jgi:hypothetical protein
MRWLLGVLAVLIVPASCAKPPEDEESKPKPSSQLESGSSCANSCGQKSPDQSCWCDTECDAIGDCCADIAVYCQSTPEPPPGSGGIGGVGSGGGGGGAQPGSGGGSGFGGYSSGGSSSGGAPNLGASCQGVCGGPAAGEVCWCDGECQQYGDCCPDFAQACGGAPPPPPGSGGGCTPQLCGTENPASQNGLPCYCDPACMQYGDCCANSMTVCGF